MKRIYGIRALVLCGCLLLSSNLFGEEPKIKIAVFNLDKISDDVSADDVRVLSDYLRNAFIKTEKFVVVSANEINTEPDIKRAVTGSVSRFGDTYVIGLRLINLKTSKYITAENIQTTNKADAIREIDSKVDILAGKAYLSISDEKDTPAPITKPAEENPKGNTKNPGQFPLVKVLNITGYSLIGASLVCAGLGIFFDISAKNNYDSAKSAYKDYQNDSTDAKWQAYQDYAAKATQNLSYRNISYIAGGVSLGLGLACVATTFFLPKDNLSVTVTPYNLTVCYQF